jgi:hypothetical protein
VVKRRREKARIRVFDMVSSLFLLLWNDGEYRGGGEQLIYRAGVRDRDKEKGTWRFGPS